MRFKTAYISREITVGMLIIINLFDFCVIFYNMDKNSWYKSSLGLSRKNIVTKNSFAVKIFA